MRTLMAKVRFPRAAQNIFAVKGCPACQQGLISSERLAILDLLQALFDFRFLVCCYREEIMNAGRLHDYRGLLPIRARLAWQEIAIASKFKGRTQVQFGFGLFEFLWIIREIFGNDMVDMKAAHIDQLSGVCTLFLVRQPYGLSFCCAEFLIGHRGPNLFN
jgi:hypothetical protein